MMNFKDQNLELVKGASHLFEEEGKLELVAELASNWLKECFN